MKQHKFIGEFEISLGSQEILDVDIVSQVKKVLKLKEGECIILCDGNRREGVARIKKSDIKSLSVDIIEVRDNLSEPKIDVTLYCSIVKKDNFEWIVQKATEVGIKTIVPIVCERTVKTNIDQKRAQKIAKEGAEQSDRGVIPQVRQIVNFKDAVREVSRYDISVIFDKSGQPFGRLLKRLSKAHLAGIFVGPEGGWTNAEIKNAVDNNCELVRLGHQILRAETAAVVASYVATSLAQTYE